ncbi:6-aminohexanoate hydrolase [Paenibacillus sambharensis]|uniref:6-aminohexanoate hydrolase n=1 Tax=Paenibacillus sambharensis TaxID=1803190 RepID=A0A2W1LD83_9BACL|nr:serine hydrolase [Paenibacillus sambharensis]PZD96040.1 6-aminohexanoate hydrolase [Paenibacillus sambharensis]
MHRDYWPTAKWEAADPASLGMDAERLAGIDPLIKADYSNINGIVVARHGYIAYESYYNGRSPEEPQHAASVTKSILSALIGIAIDAGHIESIDQKVLDFFPEYVPGAADRQKQDITIRHLLTMTVPYPFDDWKEPLDKMCMQTDWVKYVLDLLGRGGTIGAFKYATAGAHLLSAILTRSTGLSAREIANEHLFKPIGMKEVPDYGMEAFGFDDLFGHKVRGWVEDPSGISTGGWGLTLTARDMARLGLLYLSRGKWDNKQVISETWIDESTAMNPFNYGYLWWLREEDGIYTYSALGDGGNVLCCVPGHDMVIAITSDFIANSRDRWPLIKEHIFEAVMD